MRIIQVLFEKIAFLNERLTPEFIKNYYNKLFIKNVNITYGKLMTYKIIGAVILFLFLAGVKISDNKNTIYYLFNSYELKEVNNIYSDNYTPSSEEKSELLSTEIAIVKDIAIEYSYDSFVEYDKQKPGYIKAMISSKVQEIDSQVSKELIIEQIFYRLRGYLLCNKYNFMDIFLSGLLLSFIIIDTFMFFYKYLVETERKSEINMMVRELGLLGKLEHMTFDMLLSEIMSRSHHYKEYLQKIEKANMTIGSSLLETYESFDFQDEVEARYFFKILKLANIGDLTDAAEEVNMNDEIKGMERERFIKYHLNTIGAVQIVCFFASMYVILQYALSPIVRNILNISF